MSEASNLPQAFWMEKEVMITREPARSRYTEIVQGTTCRGDVLKVVMRSQGDGGVHRHGSLQSLQLMWTKPKYL